MKRMKGKVTTPSIGQRRSTKVLLVSNRRVKRDHSMEEIKRVKAVAVSILVREKGELVVRKTITQL
jgi:hypothetical protein